MKQMLTVPTFILVADIGGTNANFGIISCYQEAYELIEYYKFPSQQIVDFNILVNDLVEKIAHELHIRFSVMVIGIAASFPANIHRTQPTHLPFILDRNQLIASTGITEILFINDFICVAYGYDLVKDTIIITSIPVNPTAQKAFIGAGTGLGQAFSVWVRPYQYHYALSSEGGHTDFAISNQFDNDLSDFIKHRLAQTHAISWEQLLSGKGISLLYEFLETQYTYSVTDISREIAGSRFQPDFISRYAQHDERCAYVFRCYGDYYARFARQVALESVCFGGLYIAGGIAAKNKNLFLDEHFLRIFTDHPYHHEQLKKIPIFLVQDYKVSLYGAARYYTYYLKGLV